MAQNSARGAALKSARQKGLAIPPVSEAAAGLQPEPEAPVSVPEPAYRPGIPPCGIDPDLTVVGIGASTDGIEAITELLENLPEQTEMAFVLVLVRQPDPEDENLFTALLGSKTKLSIKLAGDGDRIEADHVYIIPSTADMVIENGTLRLGPRTSLHDQRMPIDIFFRTLAADRRNRAIGIILSGAGSDGALGIEAIKGEGGITFCQEPASAKDACMPEAALSTGCVDFVLTPAATARELRGISQHPYSRKGPENAATTPKGAGGQAAGTGIENTGEVAGLDRRNAGLQRVLALLRRGFGVDFTPYNPATLRRRVLRRMALLWIDQIEDYARFLSDHDTELLALYNDVLLKVTRFFREPAVFEFLNKRVIPRIFKGCSGRDGIRLWVPGCSTGEEAYSLAICLAEYLAERRADCPVQIFATDLSETTLDRAREGTYIENIALDVSAERLRRFFTRTGRSYRIAKSIRELIVFARHNLAKDPPFSRLGLLSCRDVLTYLDANLQKKMVSTFHYALNPKGYLVLGNSEDAGEFSRLFTPLNESTRVFVRKNLPSRVSLEPPVTDPSAEKGRFPKPAAAGSLSSDARFGPTKTSDPGWRAAGPDALQEANRLLIQRYAPPGVVVNSHFDVIQFHGQGHAHFEPAYGKASFNLLKLIKEPLAIHVRTMLAAARRGATPHRQRVTYRDHGIIRDLELEVVPLRASQEHHFLILFHGAPSDRPESASPESEPGLESMPAKDKTREADSVEALRQELATTRRHLHSIIEEQDAANEEIKHANEEILSSNEELQSANEELETAKEELQSSNDELVHVNEELQTRNTELANANNDLINLVTSINFAILMVGNDWRIRRFTAAAARLFNLIPADVGRPLSDIKPNLQLPDLSNLIDEVIRTFASKEAEVQDSGGRWYSLSIRPYQTSDRKVDGAVICLVDIGDLKRSVDAFKKSRDFSQAVIETVHEPLIVLDAELTVRSANTAFYAMFGDSPQTTLGQSFHTLTGGSWNIPRLRRLLANVLETGHRFHDFAVEHSFRETGRKFLLLNGRRIDAEDQTPPLILLTIEDITEKRQVEQQVLALSEREQRRLAQELHDGLGQHLTAITFVAQTIHHQLRQQNYADAAVNAEQLVNQVSEATGLTRDLSKGLHPMQLQANQFRTAMQALANNVSSLFKIVCTFSSDPPCLPPAGNDEAATQLYRITQEAINNALKHGKATRIAITYKHDPQSGRARLVISDDGAGSRTAACPGQTPRGMGLQIMRYRAENIGGKFHFDQAPGGGTCVTVTFGEHKDNKGG